MHITFVRIVPGIALIIHDLNGAVPGTLLAGRRFSALLMVFRPPRHRRRNLTSGRRATRPGARADGVASGDPAENL